MKELFLFNILKIKRAGAAPHTGIKAAKYDWIALSGYDDEWLPNKLKYGTIYSG